MVDTVAIFGLGLLLWTLLEYAIHGWIGHQSTSLARLHAVHHRDPHAIFTIGAWLPVAIVWTIGIALWGFSPLMVLFSGTLCGFVIYEAIHYRIHFCRPKGHIERWLREHHLGHHQRMPHRCFGVTSPLWDLIFGTEPTRDREPLFASVRDTAPIAGRTNIRLLFAFHYFRRPKD